MIGEDGIDLGIQALIDQPSEAGADRLVNAVAGHVHYGGPLIIVDFGTGTTFDVVDDQGNYIGGAIAPGINLSVEALYMAAAKLPRIARSKKRIVPRLLSIIPTTAAPLRASSVSRRRSAN